jgi:hypothetical protein
LLVARHKICFIDRKSNNLKNLPTGEYWTRSYYDTTYGVLEKQTTAGKSIGYKSTGDPYISGAYWTNAKVIDVYGTVTQTQTLGKTGRDIEADYTFDVDRDPLDQYPHYDGIVLGMGLRRKEY